MTESARKPFQLSAVNVLLIAAAVTAIGAIIVAVINYASEDHKTRVALAFPLTLTAEGKAKVSSTKEPTSTATATVGSQPTVKPPVLESTIPPQPGLNGPAAGSNGAAAPEQAGANMPVFAQPSVTLLHSSNYKTPAFSHLDFIGGDWMTDVAAGDEIVPVSGTAGINKRTSISFEMTNTDELTLKIESIHVELISYEDFQSYNKYESPIPPTGPGPELASVIDYRCDLKTTPGLYSCELQASEGSYIRLRKGDMDTFRLNLSAPAVGVYRVGVQVIYSIAGQNILAKFKDTAYKTFYSPDQLHPDDKH